MANSTRNLDAALRYASYGWAVFPLRPNDKRPLSLHGFHDATTDAEQITRWWTNLPNAGIGIATGSPSGLIVLDVDPRNNGHHSLLAIQAQYEDLPLTPEALTGGGGRHYFFKHPGGVLPSAKPWPGIDIKAEGGYVAACPSIHPSGLMYRWAQGKDPDALSLTPAPTWLVTLLTERKSKLLADVTPIENDGPRKLTQGSRNDGLTSLAGTMQRRGMSFDAILAAILAENAAKCKPPLSESECALIVQSVSRYAPDEEAVPQDVRVARMPLMDMTGAMDEEPPPVDWLLDGWLARGDAALMAGAPGLGKSWLTLDMAISGAAGLPIFNHFLHEPFRTLIVDEENPPDEVRRRIYALALARGIKSRDLEGRFMMTAPRHGFSFRQADKVRDLKALITSFEPELIIFDSLTALSTIDEEGDAVQVRRFFHECVNQLQSICGSTILCIHHTNKGVYLKERMSEDSGLVRGSIDMIGAVDTMWLLDTKKSSDNLYLSNLKARRTKQPQLLKLSLDDTSNGGVHPNVLLGGPREATGHAEKLILLHLTGGAWVPNLYELVRASAGEMNRATFDWAALKLFRKGLIEKKSDPEASDKRTRLYRLK